MADDKKQEVVEAALRMIRESAEIGVGTCSIQDECSTDDELREELAEDYDEGSLEQYDFTTAEGLVAWQVELNQIFWGRQREADSMMDAEVE
jgi:hypothetical protein